LTITPKMKSGAKLIWLAAILIIAFFGGVWLSGLRKETRSLQLNRYDYRDTRQLVTLTARAAELIGTEGEKAFARFRDNPDKWTLGGDSYLYVYDLGGINLFHGGYPELEGKNLIDFTDLLGKKTVRMIIDQLEKYPRLNPHGWIHYLWVPPGSLDGVWKSSCNFKVRMPGGQWVFVGSGIDSPMQEREFYRINVDEAGELIEEKGSSAFQSLKDPRGRFTIHDRGIFVIDRGGKAIIDPGLPLDPPRNLFEYRDLTGRRPIFELNEKLNSRQCAWVVTLDREKAGSKPVKKGIYGRRAHLDGEDVIVGAISPRPRPAWMR